MSGELAYNPFSINRNIVECKAGNLEMTYKLIDSINRNIVECKDEIHMVID